MIAWLVKGRKAVNMLKTNCYDSPLVIFYKPVAKYACIPYIVMIQLSEQVRLIKGIACV